MANMFFGLTKLELRKAVFDYAEKNMIPHRFNKDNKLAGKDWLDGFLKRNERISIRKPEATSLNRIKAFNKVEVKKFYQNLEEVMNKYNFQPDRIYNFDETGKNIVHKPKLIIAKKGMKRVGGATSGERGKNHTVACAVSAAGHYIPPMIIFPRVRMSPNLMIDGPPGTVYKASKSGYITEELFVEWLVHFKEKKKTKTIFGPLNTAFNDACDALMKANGYMAITSEQLPSLLKTAWNKICSTEKAVNGFAAAGICPYNPNIFNDDEFYVEPEIVQNEVEMANAQVPEANVELSDDILLEMDMTNTEIEHLENCNATEEELVNNGFVVVEPLIPVLPETSAKVTLSDIVPVPTAGNQTKSKRKPREKQHSEVMTSPEYKFVLDEKRKRRELKIQKKHSNQEKKLLKQQKEFLNQQADTTTKKRGRPKKSGETESKNQKRVNSGKRGPVKAAKKKESSQVVNSNQSFEQFFVDNLSFVQASDDSDESY